MPVNIETARLKLALAIPTGVPVTSAKVYKNILQNHIVF